MNSAYNSGRQNALFLHGLVKQAYMVNAGQLSGMGALAGIGGGLLGSPDGQSGLLPASIGAGTGAALGPLGGIGALLAATPAFMKYPRLEPLIIPTLFGGAALTGAIPGALAGKYLPQEPADAVTSEEGIE